MPHVEASTVLPHPVARVFDFLSVPANLIEVTPPEFSLRLVEAPERLHLGARIVLQTRSWGFSQRLVSEVTAFEPDHLLVDEQREGPFRKWIHAHLLEVVPQGTRMTDRIEFEAPGGMLGWMLSAETIRHELQELFAYRERRFKELLDGKADPHPESR
jgi:ligand-binding SRPBCC domain-containing protein